MIKLNIHEAKTHLSQYLPRVEQGETIILCRRNLPIAEIRPIRTPSNQPRPVGLAQKQYGDWELSPSFFDPLPDEVLDLFEGKS